MLPENVSIAGAGLGGGLGERTARPPRRSTCRLVKQPRAAGRMTSEAGRRPVPARHKCDFRWGGSGYDALSQRRRTNCREADRRSCERPASVARRIEAWGCWRSGAAESRSRGWPLLRATVLPVACRRVGSMVLPPSEPIGWGDCPRERPKNGRSGGGWPSSAYAAFSTVSLLPVPMAIRRGLAVSVRGRVSSSTPWSQLAATFCRRRRWTGILYNQDESWTAKVPCCRFFSALAVHVRRGFVRSHARWFNAGRSR